MAGFTFYRCDETIFATIINAMDNSFVIPVLYKGKEIGFNAQLLALGYTHKIQVDVNGQEVLFEPDEERNYRAVIANPSQDKQVDVELLKIIAQTIEAIVK